jgi:hypothetical protein
MIAATSSPDASRAMSHEDPQQRPLAAVNKITVKPPSRTSTWLIKIDQWGFDKNMRLGWWTIQAGNWNQTEFTGIPQGRFRVMRTVNGNTWAQCGSEINWLVPVPYNRSANRNCDF